MAAILISGHYPSIHQQDVVRNPRIEIFLDREINTSTVKNNNIIVTDYLYNPVEGTVGWEYYNKGTISGVASILTFTPDTYLDPETTYNVVVPDYPDSVMATDGSYIQDKYSFKFYTGISTVNNTEPTQYEQWLIDLAAAVEREDYTEAARIQDLIDGTSSGTIAITIEPTGDLEVLNTYPTHLQSNIPFNKLKYFKLTFNDSMPASGIDYNAYINVTTKNVLE